MDRSHSEHRIRYAALSQERNILQNDAKAYEEEIKQLSRRDAETVSTVEPFLQMNAVDDDGWCEWVHPLPGYLMKCCDCGLVHELDTHIVRQIGPADAEGRWEGEVVEEPDLKVQIRMRRDAAPAHVGDSSGSSGPKSIWCSWTRAAAEADDPANCITLTGMSSCEEKHQALFGNAQAQQSAGNDGDDDWPIKNAITRDSTDEEIDAIFDSLLFAGMRRRFLTVQQWAPVQLRLFTGLRDERPRVLLRNRRRS